MCCSSTRQRNRQPTSREIPVGLTARGPPENCPQTLDSTAIIEPAKGKVRPTAGPSDFKPPQNRGPDLSPVFRRFCAKLTGEGVGPAGHKTSTGESQRRTSPNPSPNPEGLESKLCSTWSPPQNRKMQSVLKISMALTAAYVVATFVFGIRAHSLALISEAGHNVSDLSSPSCSPS